MTDVDETTTDKRRAGNYDTFNRRTFRESYIRQSSKRISKRMRSLRAIPRISASLIPGTIEDEHEMGILNRKGEVNANFKEDGTSKRGISRSFRRRLYLFLTEPSSSRLSAVFFFFLIVAIFMSNLIMIMETMPSFQYRPTECNFCAEDGKHFASFEKGAENIPECECPLRPLPYLERFLGYCLNFFALEWTLRVLSFVPADPQPGITSKLIASFNFLTSTTTLMDALAIWPYYIERFNAPGLISLRLLRLFRVFQLLRLGSYNSMFVSLTQVLYNSIAFLRLMVVIMSFGATIFGSLLFW